MSKEKVKQFYSIYKQSREVCTDTRKAKKGSIFFALKGENFNGNKFALEALDSGCAYAVIDEAEFAIDYRFFLVEDVLTFLQELAHYHRTQLSIPVLAITGSNGKTTTKELLHKVLSKKFKTSATVGNLNNHIGVPFTLLAIDKSTEFAIVEMGANHQGEIDMLCRLAEPDFGLITNIGKAHLEGFGGAEGVLRGKTELYRFLQSKNGKVFVNDIAENLMEQTKGMSQILYGNSELAIVNGSAKDDSLEFLSIDWSNNKTGFSGVIRTHLVGAYNIHNVLAAICIGVYFGVSDNDIISAIESYEPDNNRSQQIKKGSNTIIMDAYNANPSSMREAILNFSKLTSENKILILGDMRELGEYSAAEHQEVVDLLKREKCSSVYLVGKDFQKTLHEGFQSFPDVVALKQHINENKIEKSTLLIKGSRGVKLEGVLEVL